MGDMNERPGFGAVERDFSGVDKQRLIAARKHRHTPEIAQGLGLPNNSAALIFTPHLLPINRGILSTIYAKLKAGVTRADSGGNQRHRHE